MFVQNKFVLQVWLNRFQCLVVVFSSILNLLKENTFAYRKKWYYFTKPITRSFKTVIVYTEFKNTEFFYLFIYLTNPTQVSFWITNWVLISVFERTRVSLTRVHFCLLNIYDLRNSLDVSFVAFDRLAYSCYGQYL